jgi:transcriptional regulator with XRE-family HTH domain
MSMRRRRGTGGDRPEEEIAPSLGKTIQRLRKAYNMSLGELSEQSGVAKSIISQIERNETNPTIGTVWRLSRALDITLEEALKSETRQNFLQHQTKAGIPILTSEDGLCTLYIIGALELVETFQVYDFHAKPGGTLDSEAHQQGCVEHLSVLKGELQVTVAGESRVVRQGETLRYRADAPHCIVNIGTEDAHATMVVALRSPVVEERR